ncbi:MAG: YceI family protein, partial [Myxococcota bacterium]|nr:YceI family protein [Myxococcota bacterium]
GTFNTFTVSESKQAPNVMESLKDLSIEIDTSSVESNNPARNATIAGVYFAKFAPATQIKGKVISAAGDNKQGTMKINMDMNGVSKDLDFTYEVKGEELEATGVMEMMDFNLKGPFDAIHEACKALHTGADGVAKTWTEVALKVTAQVKVSCN